MSSSNFWEAHGKPLSVLVLGKCQLNLWGRECIWIYLHFVQAIKALVMNLQCYSAGCVLTHWGRVTHICVGNLTITGSGNGLSPGRRQATTWTNIGILLIGPLGTNFSEMLIEIHTFSFKKIHLKMPSGKWRPFCLGLNVLMKHYWMLCVLLQLDSNHQGI